MDFVGISSDDLFSNTFDFTPDNVTRFLNSLGLVYRNNKCRVEQFSKYIFLHGDEHEVYNNEERRFIGTVGNLYVYSEFYKKTKRGTMPCRVISAELQSMEPLKSCVFFMKEVNKAIDGCNLFFIKAGNTYFFGMRKYSKNPKDDCIVSRAIVLLRDMEEICENIFYVSESDDFIPFYESMIVALEINDPKYDDYDAKVISKRGIQYEYLNMLLDVEKVTGLSTQAERNRYVMSFDDEVFITYNEELEEVYADLRFIESFKANTVEMLFEAEEMEKLAIKAEEDNRIALEKHVEIKDCIADEVTKDLLDDPEKMIKLLKLRRGI